MIQTPQILFHRPTLWMDDVQCSTKTLARLFAQNGFDVTYLQNQLDPLHVLLGKYSYYKTWRETPAFDEGVNILSQFTPIPVRDLWPLNSSGALNLRYRFAMPQMSAIGINNCKYSPDLVWTTVPGSGTALRNIFPASKIVFHVIDYYPAFRGLSVKKLERSDYASVDEIFLIGHALVDYLVSDLGVPRAKISVLGQGVEIEKFTDQSAVPSEIANAPRPRAIWSGVLKKGDPDLFEEVASCLEKLGGSLILIGPTAHWAEQLAAKRTTTVKLLGSIKNANLPPFLAHSDVGLMLYDQERKVVYRGQNPLKLYEYAAAGLPVLSTPHDEFDHISAPIMEVSRKDEIWPALKKMLGHQNELRAASLAFAKQHSWNAIVNSISNRYFPNFSENIRPTN